MSWSSWLSAMRASILGGSSRKVRRRRPSVRCRPWLNVLEDRLAPAVAVSFSAANTLLIAGYGDVNLATGVGAQALNLAPRFGFAYRLSNRQVIRGGYGISYWTGRFGFIELGWHHVRQLQQLAPGRLQHPIQRSGHRLVAGTHHQRGRNALPVLDKGAQLIGREKHPHVIERARHALGPQEKCDQSHRRAIGDDHVPAAVSDDGGKRFVAAEQKIDRAPGVGEL